MTSRLIVFKCHTSPLVKRRGTVVLATVLNIANVQKVVAIIIFLAIGKR